jgi:hypothetical protein
MEPGVDPFFVVHHLVESIRQTTEAIVWGENNDETIFDLFCERQALAGFISALLSQSTPQPIKVQLLQTLSILVQNARRDTSFFYLLSGGFLNTLLAGALDSEDDEVGYVYGALDLHDEEVLSYFVTFVKGLALRLDGGSAQLCVDERSPPSAAQGFPLFAQAVRFTTHREMMVRTAARMALLSLLRISHPKVRSHTVEAARGMLVPSLVRAFSVAWAAAGTAVQLGDVGTLQVVFEAEQDLLEFFNDLMLLDITPICEALARGFLFAGLLPLLSVLAPSPHSTPASIDAGADSEVLEPAQRALVANVAQHVLAAHSTSGESLSRRVSNSSRNSSQNDAGGREEEPSDTSPVSPSRMTMRMVTCQEDAEGIRPGVAASCRLVSADGSSVKMGAPTASVAVRAAAACARTLGTHRSIVEPLAKALSRSTPSPHLRAPVLLWPSLPRMVAKGVHSPGAEGCNLIAAFQGTGSWASNSRSSECGGKDSFAESPGRPGPNSPATSPSKSPKSAVLKAVAEGGADTAAGCGEDEVLVPNPFRHALLALISDSQRGAAPPEAPIVAWAMLELQAVLPRWLQEGVGLLPRRTASRSQSVCEATPSNIDVAGSGAEDEVALPVHLVHAVRTGARLPRIAQRAVTSALVDLLSPPRARGARLQAAAIATEALQEALKLFRENLAQSSEDGGGADALAAFLEEWEWQRHRNTPIDLPATCGGAQCLLRTGRAVVDLQSPAPVPSHAARALLTLRRLCADLTALSEEGPQAEPDLSAGGSSCSPGSKARNSSVSAAGDGLESLSTGEGSASSGTAVALGSLSEATEIIECVEPKDEGGTPGVQYTSSRCLVLHPTLLLITEPPIGDGGVAVVRVRMPVWQVVSSIDAVDPHVLTISTTTSTAELGELGKRRLVLHFPELGGSARALMHIEGCRAREVKRLMAQLEFFIDTIAQEVDAFSNGAAAFKHSITTDGLEDLLKST